MRRTLYKHVAQDLPTSPEDPFAVFVVALEGNTPCLVADLVHPLGHAYGLVEILSGLSLAAACGCIGENLKVLCSAIGEDEYEGFARWREHGYVGMLTAACRMRERVREMFRQPVRSRSHRLVESPSRRYIGSGQYAGWCGSAAHEPGRRNESHRKEEAATPH